ncbi:hypothetical protein D3C81_2112890 [compost metagenome]
MDRLDLRHDQVRPLLGDQRPQSHGIEHVQHVGTVRDLHGRRIGVTVGGDHFHAEALQLDRHLLAELTGPQQQDAGGAWGLRST